MRSWRLHSRLEDHLMDQNESILDIISRLGEKEKDLLSNEFISPVFDNIKIATRVSGVIYQLKIPDTKPGWYKFKAKNPNEATVIAEADLSDIENYLKRLPNIRVVLVQRSGRKFLAIPHKQNSFGLDPVNPIWVLLPDDQALDFDTVIVRYDSVRFWYHGQDPKSDGAKNEYLRESFTDNIDSDRLKFPGLTLEDKMAYSMRYAIDKEAMEKKTEFKLKNAIEHGGGDFVSFVEKSDHFRVTYKVDRRQYTSTVTKDNNLSILSAGICLSGQDSKFDLKSIIPVLREGHRTNAYFEVYNLESDDE